MDSLQGVVSIIRTSAALIFYHHHSLSFARTLTFSAVLSSVYGLQHERDICSRLVTTPIYLRHLIKLLRAPVVYIISFFSSWMHIFFSIIKYFLSLLGDWTFTRVYIVCCFYHLHPPSLANLGLEYFRSIWPVVRSRVWTRSNPGCQHITMQEMIWPTAPEKLLEQKEARPNANNLQNGLGRAS